MEQGLLAESSLLPIVCVVLMIPRRYLDHFNRNTKDIEPPNLSIATRQRSMDRVDYFYGIQCFFGKLSLGSNRSFCCNVEEDRNSWCGLTDLLVTCQVPTFSLLIGPREGVRVALIASHFRSESPKIQGLKFQKKIFEAGLDDQESLYILNTPPKFSERQRRMTTASPATSILESSADTMHLKLNFYSEVDSLRIHTDLSKDSVRSSALAIGSSRREQQKSPNTLFLEPDRAPIDVINFQFPINIRGHQIHVGKYFKEIEVTMLMSDASDKREFEENASPVILGLNYQLIAWNIPRVCLERLPQYSFQSHLMVHGDWDVTHAHIQAASPFHPISALETSDASRACTALKRTINWLFWPFRFKSETNPRSRCCILYDGKTNARHTLVLPSKIRLDLDSGAPILDGYAIPLDCQRQSKYAVHIRRLWNEDFQTLKTSPHERALWRDILPAFVERCWVGWEHQADCKRLVESNDPDDIDSNPFCACGDGRNVIPEDFSSRPLWSVFASIATRVAIPRMSVVPYWQKPSPYVDEAFAPIPPDEQLGTAPCANCRRRVSILVSKSCTCEWCTELWYCGLDCQSAI